MIRKVLNRASLVAIAAAFGVLANTRLAHLNPAATGAVAFPSFSAGVEKTIEFDTSSATYQALSPREKREQQRDWMLYAILASASVPAVEIEQALYDVPPVRSDLLSHLGQAETGQVRSRMVGLDRPALVALIPKGSEAARADFLAEVADEQRKNSGDVPDLIHVFEYDFLDGDAAAVTYRGSRRGAELFQESAGYVEATIAGLSDLERFLAATDDVVAARVEGSNLVLAGRRLASPPKGIGVMEIASIWQSSRKDPDRLGFSLDPQIDYQQLEATMVRAGWMPAPARSPSDAESGFDLEQLQAGLNPTTRRKPVDRLERYHAAFLNALEGKASNEDLEQSFDTFVMANRFQKARYDGDFQGTEVGMVLFYTDLLMKLWGQDQSWSTPLSIPEFPNELTLNPSSIHAAEVASLPGTRLWLGLRDTAMQKDPSGGLYFGRIVTRLFAVPHDLLADKDLKEAEPNVFDRVFIDWWNRHYAEVAQYEPQYQRLNAIMKWSSIVGWLHTRQRSDALRFLGSIEVFRAHRFPAWVQSQEGLTFHRWTELGFFEQGYRGTTTEALRIQVSRLFTSFGEGSRFLGGVSLAGKAKIREAPILSRELPASVRRGGFSVTEKSPELTRLVSPKGNSFRLESVKADVARSWVEAGEGVRLRGSLGELKAVPLERIVERDAGGISVASRQGNHALGDLRVARTANGLRAGWTPRDLDSAYILARDASGAAEPASAIAANGDVAAVVQTGPDEYFAQLRGSRAWVHLSRNAAESTGVREGFLGRASRGPTSPVVDFSVVSTSEAAQGTAALDLVEVQAGQRGVVTVSVVAERPPAAIPIQIEFEGTRISAHRSGDSLVFRWKDLPPAVRENPAKIGQLVDVSREKAIKIPWEEDLRTREYSRIAERVAADPGSVGELDRAVDAEFRRNASLWKQGRTAELRGRIARLQVELGDLPALRIQKALLQLDEKNLAGAARTLDGAGARPPSRAGAFLDELDARLADARLDEASRGNLQAVAEYVELSRLKSASATLGAQVEDGTLRVSYRVDRIRTAPGEIPAGDARAFADAAVYVENAPGLDTTDWSPTTAPSRVQGWIESKRVDVVALQDVDLRSVRPSLLVEGQSHKTYHLANAGGRVLPRTNSSRCSEEDRRPFEARSPPCRAYLVRARDPAANRP